MEPPDRTFQLFILMTLKDWNMKWNLLNKFWRRQESWRQWQSKFLMHGQRKEFWRNYVPKALNNMFTYSWVRHINWYLETHFWRYVTNVFIFIIDPLYVVRWQYYFSGSYLSEIVWWKLFPEFVTTNMQYTQTFWLFL